MSRRNPENASRSNEATATPMPPAEGARDARDDGAPQGARPTAHGQAYGQRPVVQDQPNDPTRSPRAEEPEARAGTDESARDDAGLDRSDEELQRASESGTGRAASEKRASDGVDEQRRARRS